MPLKSFDAMVTEHRGSTNRSCVCCAKLEKKNIGLPSSSTANWATDPLGYPSIFLLLVDRTENPWLYWTRLRTSSVIPGLGAFFWCSSNAFWIVSSVGEELENRRVDWWTMDLWEDGEKATAVLDVKTSPSKILFSFMFLQNCLN